MRLIAALAFALVAATVSAQGRPAPPVPVITPAEPVPHFDAVPQAPPLAPADLFWLQFSVTPASGFSAGWDFAPAVAIGPDRLMRIFYRRSDGLAIGLVKTVSGQYIGATRPFAMIANADIFNATLVARDGGPYEWEATIAVFAYSRSSGVDDNRTITWKALFR